MIELMIAAAMMQAGPEPCNAAALPDPAPAGCPHWRFIGRSDRAEAFVDAASVRRDGALFRVNLRILYYQDRPDGTRSGVSRMRFDCARRMVASEHMIEFDAGGVRRVDVEMSGTDAEPYPALSGQPGGALLDEFCPR